MHHPPNDPNSPETLLTDRVIDVLKEQGYISKNTTQIQDMMQIPEYQILSLILNQHPISLDLLEEITKRDSLSLVLSNLLADDLIAQTNNYQWTITEKVKN